MKKWLIAFLGIWILCLLTIFVCWLVGLTINCFFISGCVESLSFHKIIGAVSGKSVIVRGSILAVVFIAITWINRRS